MLIESFVITGKLRIVIENLFQTSNATIFLGRNHPATNHLSRCMVKRLDVCINDLGLIIKELEPPKIDTTSLTLEDVLLLEEYAEIRRGLVKSWQFIDAREQAIIIQQAANRQTENRVPNHPGPVND